MNMHDPTRCAVSSEPDLFRHADLQSCCGSVPAKGQAHGMCHIRQGCVITTADCGAALIWWSLTVVVHASFVVLHVATVALLPRRMSNHCTSSAWQGCKCVRWDMRNFGRGYESRRFELFIMMSCFACVVDMMPIRL